MHAEVGESRDVLIEGLDQDSREAISVVEELCPVS